MKFCPQCTNGYHNSYTACPTHGGLLNEIRDLKPGMVIRGTYRIVRKLGRGGMGDVYLAEHTLLGELAALKFLSSDLSLDTAASSRFLREVRALRQVRNPNVVDCSDLERAEDDSLFFSMEFVDGPDLRDFLIQAHGPLDVPQALGIARGIANGLGAAHARGIVHRDIKPENVLMARAGNELIPKIADFGIVATKESNLHRTRTGMSMLTMSYAAPEQWRGMPAAEIDGRADLYALGGILFEMLTGRTAFNAENYQGWMYQHLTATPPSPSSLRPELANWKGLDQLVQFLLAKDREQRPKDVAELLTLLDKTEYATSRPEPGVSELLTVQGHNNGTVSVRFSPDGRTLASGGYETIKLWDPSSGRLLRTIPGHARYNVLSIAFSPDGRAVASASMTGSKGMREGFVDLWDVASGRLLHEFQGDCGHAYSVAFSHEGIVASGSINKAIGLWNASNARPLRAMQGQILGFISIAFRPDGRILAAGGIDGRIKLWDVSNGQQLHVFLAHDDSVDTMAFSPDGRTLVSGGHDSTIKFWDAGSGQLLRTLHGDDNSVDSLAFSPDGDTVASGGYDTTAKLWDVPSGKLIHVLQGHTRAVSSVAFSPDGKRLVSGSLDGTIKLWDVSNMR